MKKSLLTFLGIILFSVINNTISGQIIIASWSFDALVAPTADVPTASVISADYGSSTGTSTIYLDGTNGSSSWISVPTNPELTAFSGSTLNDPRPVINSGNALALANSSANSKNMIIKFSTLTLNNIVVTFATRGTATGFDTHAWAWSTDNITYTPIGSNPANKTSTWSVETLNLSSITAINNASTVYLKLTVTGATSASGNNRIDNLTIYSDTQAPVPSFNPANNATDVAVNVNPTITFDEPVRKTDGSPVMNSDLTSIIAFNETDVFGTNVIFSGTIDASKKVITITPNGTLKGSQQYYIAIGPVEDESGNQSSTQSITFTTTSAASPTVTVIYPNGGEKMYSGDQATITWSTTNFDAGEKIKIEAYVPDDQLVWGQWVPIVPSTANDGSEVVTVGPAPYGTQYLIRVSGVTNGAYDESNTGFTIIATAATLETLRIHQIGAIVKFTGVATVTYTRSSNNQKYIQDATAAILIHDPSGYVSGTYTVGSGITNVEGKMTLYSGLLELVPQAATGEAATGPVITPQVVDITTLTYNDQCKLIKVEKAKFDNPYQYDATNGLFVASKNYDLFGLSNTSFAYRTAFSESDYIGTAVPSKFFNAVVLVGQFNLQMQITARNLADITLLSDAKAITSFVFAGLDPDVTGTIDETGKTVTLSVPGGTNVTALVPTIAVSANATVSPLTGVAADFTSPVVYSVTAEDGTTQAYTVTVSTQTGIEKISEMDIKIYPVPATSELTVNNFRNLQTIEVLDVTGRVIKSINIINDQEIRIPVGNLRKGLYLLRFNSTNGNVIKRFIKS